MALGTGQAESAQFPRTFTIPREGRLVRATADSFEQLREIRTELELLRRIRRRLASSAVRSIPLAEAKYSPQQRAELQQIVRDAQQPVVEQMVTIVDREFGDVRNEIVMSVVNEQAENIVQEAVESGAISLASDITPEPPAETLSLEDALAAAEAELAKATQLAASATARDNGGPKGAQALASDKTPRPPPLDDAWHRNRIEQVVAQIEAAVRELSAILSADPDTSSKRAQTVAPPTSVVSDLGTDEG